MLRRAARPAFPAGAPPDFVDLAARCWEADPERRPPLSEVSQALQAMSDALAADAAAAQAAADAEDDARARAAAAAGARRPPAGMAVR